MLWDYDLANLSSLDISRSTVSNLKGLEWAVNLTELVAFETHVTDLTHLSGLTNLEELHLDDNDIVDITPLSQLTSLKHLNLGVNRISDVTALSGLTNLEYLNLRKNRVKDLTPLAGLSSITDFVADLQEITLPNATVGVSTAHGIKAPNGNPLAVAITKGSGTTSSSNPGRITWTSAGANEFSWNESVRINDVFRTFSGTATQQVKAAPKPPTPATPKFNFAQVVPTPDLNGDGYGDVLAVDHDGVLWLYSGTANGALGQSSRIGSGWEWGPYDIIPAGDVTGDGIPDVLAIDKGGVLYYYAGNGRGGFTGKLTKNGQGWTNIDLYPAGDLNGDGNSDILSIRKDGTLHTHLGRGDGGFSKSIQSGQGWAGYELFAGSDANRDGLADLYSRNSNGELFFYAGRAGGGFRAAVKVGTGW